MLSIGTVSGGFGFNVICDKVRLSGTARSMTPRTQEVLKSRLCEMCCATAAMYGGAIDVDYTCECR